MLTAHPVGTAGWSYEDWNAIVYPERPPRGFDRLAPDGVALRHQRDQLDLLPDPAAAMTENWARQVEHNPRFAFTAKLYPRIHARARVGRRRRDAFLDAMEPLARGEDGSDASSSSFRSRSTTRRRIAAPGGDPRTVWRPCRSRSSSATRPGIPRTRGNSCRAPRGLRQHRPACARRQPPADRARHRADRLLPVPRTQRRRSGSGPTPPTKSVTTTSTPPASSTPGCRAFADAAERAPGGVYAILNNHFRGQAVANALELQALLTGETRDVARSLRARLSLDPAHHPADRRRAAETTVLALYRIWHNGE